jgi:hypothetical protein
MRLLMPATTMAAVAIILLLALESGEGQISGLNIGTAAALGVAGMIMLLCWSGRYDNALMFERQV